jgi:hypothetical protein
MWLGKKEDEISISGKRVLVPVGLEGKIKPKISLLPNYLMEPYRSEQHHWTQYPDSLSSSHERHTRN